LAIWTTGELAKYSGVPIYPYRWKWTGGLTAAWLLSAILLRVLVQHIHRSGYFARRIVLVGMDSYARQLNDLPRWTHERCHFVAGPDADTLNSPTELATLVAREFASEVVVAVGSKPLPWHVLAYCKMSGVRVTDYLDFYERESRRICIENLREDWIALSRGFYASKLPLQRSIDFLLSVAGFVVTAPVLLFTALAIKLEDGGPIFYLQERIGLGGRPFVLIKFRSMREDAESDGTPAWAAERDTRITRVGRLIRMLRIDELPQLWNVLRGDMSIIGPRPERPYFVRQFSQLIPFYDYRHAVRPGITGWAQVSYHYGASLEDARRKLSYDLYYIKNRGMVLAWVILLKTIGVVARGQGAR
jgi:sugar transferase (PEP-CTERM system associated)